MLHFVLGFMAHFHHFDNGARLVGYLSMRGRSACTHLLSFTLLLPSS
jgi:hypothetical protein